MRFRCWFLVWSLLVLSNTVQGSQDDWTEWSSCSQSCGQGIRHKEKLCYTNQCDDNSRLVQVCNLQACKGKTIDYRTAECRKQDSRKFRGRRYQWEKYVNPMNKCSLACRALYYGFFWTFADKVKDGTSCDDSISDKVCINGQCQKVGCDGVVGSGAVRDKCGECNGDNKSCQLISGIYTRTHLPYGYNLITRLPPGSCNINITELARSRNYLALRRQDGSYILNGGKRLSFHGNYKGGGTTFIYSRNKGRGCRGECLHADGPLNETIEVQLLTYRRNPGIMYQFTVPSHMAKDVMQRIIPRLSIRGDNRVPSSRQSQQHRTNDNHNRKLAAADSDTKDRVVYHGYQNIPTGNGSYPIPQLGSATIPNRRTEIQKYKPPQYIPSQRNTDLYNPQRLSIDGRGRSDLSNRQRTWSNYYSYYNRNINQAASADYGQRYGNSNSVTKSENAIDGTNSEYTRRNTKEEVNSAIKTSRFSAQNIPDSINYIWRITGFTDCSTTCGGGVQETKIICVKKNTNLIVTSDNCDPRIKPTSQRVKCNTRICPPGWTAGNWSACSVSCGQGMEIRQVFCKQKVSSQVYITVSTSRCSRPKRPQSARSCKSKPCAVWKSSEWSKCSADCGKGEKTRDVTCESLDGATVEDGQCIGRKPHNKQICDMGTCAEGWFHSKWSESCSQDCGKGYTTRKVYCLAGDGTPLEEEKCSKSKKPRDRKPCLNTKPCGGSWFEGPWSECSATCGNGTQKRSLVCIKKLGEKLFAIVAEENCDGKEKPKTERSCENLPACNADWFMTGWTKCSESCGTGSRTREVRCLDPNFKPSESCIPSDKPRRRSTCNKQSCEQPQLDQDPHCKDKLKQCHIVVQARLCSYRFYSEKCCESCKKHKLQYQRGQKRYQ